MIGAAEGSKYCAVCRVRRSRSKIGLAKAGISAANWSRDSIFDGHMRTVTAGRTEALASEKSLGGHPVSVIGSHVGAIDVALFQGGDSSGVQPERRPADLGIGQRGEIAGLEALQPATVHQVPDRLFAVEPARHNLCLLHASHERRADPLHNSARNFTAFEPAPPPAAPASPG